MSRLVSLLVAPLVGAVLGLAALPVDACSDFILDHHKSLNGDVVSARTMDFPAMDFYKNQLSRVTRGTTWRSFAWDTANPGQQWTMKYGFIGMDFAVPTATLLFHQRLYNDGMNEEGLSAGLLWMDEGEFRDRYESGRVLQPTDLHYLDLVPWILGNFKNVAEVKEALEQAVESMFGTSVTSGPEALILAVPLHLVVHDSSGHSLIAEWYRDDDATAPSMHLHSGDEVDTVGVMTNEPPYPQHLVELKKKEYESITNLNAMAGTPGGFDSSGRFIRLAKIRQFLDEAQTNDRYRNVDAVAQTLHAINNVDLGHGVQVDPIDANIPDLGWYQETGATLVRDHTHRVLYFKGLHNQTLQRIEYAKVDFSGLPGGGTIGPSIPMDIDPAKSARYAQGVDVTPKLTAAQVIYPDAAQSTFLDPKYWKANVHVRVSVAAADQGKTGNYYIYAVDPQQRYWNWTGPKYGWKQVPRGSLLPAASGALATRTFDNVLYNVDFRTRKGWRIFAGYGTSPADMLLGGNVAEVYVVEDDPGYLDPIWIQKWPQ